MADLRQGGKAPKGVDKVPVGVGSCKVRKAEALLQVSRANRSCRKIEGGRRGIGEDWGLWMGKCCSCKVGDQR